MSKGKGKKKGLLVGMGTTTICCIVVLVVIVGGFIVSQYIIQPPNGAGDTNGNDNGGTQPFYSDPTDTTTDTTTEPTGSGKYTFRTKWDFVPILDVGGPEWLDVAVYDYIEGLYKDGTSMPNENEWYNSINYATITFLEGDIVDVWLDAPDGWDFQLGPSDPPSVLPKQLTVGVDWSGNLWCGLQDWGDFWFEWVEIP